VDILWISPEVKESPTYGAVARKFRFQTLPQGVEFVVLVPVLAVLAGNV
jgi:hypothetical protein